MGIPKPATREDFERAIRQYGELNQKYNDIWRRLPEEECNRVSSLLVIVKNYIKVSGIDLTCYTIEVERIEAYLDGVREVLDEYREENIEDVKAVKELIEEYRSLALEASLDEDNKLAIESFLEIAMSSASDAEYFPRGCTWIVEDVLEELESAEKIILRSKRNKEVTI